MFKLGVGLCVRSFVSGCRKPPVVKAIKKERLVSFNVHSIRNNSFFNRLSQEELWKATTSVSNAGRRKGRGKGGDRKSKRNLNAGQIVGHGKVGVQFPGLNIGVLDGNVLNEVRPLPQPHERQKVIQRGLSRRRFKVHPLDRGWSGGSLRGRRLGPPDPVQDENYDNFQSIILEHKVAIVQTALIGKKRRFFSLIGIGNGEGVFGFGVAKRIDSRISLNLAKNRAVKKLLTVDLIEKYTVNHDFCSQYGSTRVLVFKRPRGHGLVCHRVIAAICKLIGIEDLSAKVEGPTRVIHIVRAFVTGLLRQKTYQEIADEKKLHLVEFREECLNFPKVLASPKECLSQAEVQKNPVLFEEYIMGNRLVCEKEEKIPFFTKLPGWLTHLKKTEYHRNHEKVIVDLLVKYGSMRSHLTDVYPECISPAQAKKKES